MKEVMINSSCLQVRAFAMQSKLDATKEKPHVLQLMICNVKEMHKKQTKGKEITQEDAVNAENRSVIKNSAK